MTGTITGHRPTWVGTSWKMNKTVAETRDYCARLARTELPENVQAFILPPLTALAAARETLPLDSPVLLGAQNAHWAQPGAWTGEVSMGMVHEAGARLVEIGHSERRQHFAESDETVARKVAAALAHGLIPLLCVGEPTPVRRSGRAEAFVLAQLESAVAQIPARRVAEMVVAYEPIWAIGEDGVPATPDDIHPVVAALSARLTDLTGGAGCRALLYGGSVDPDNAGDLLGLSELDGLFVGRAAWHVDGLITLVEIGARRHAAAPQAPLTKVQAPLTETQAPLAKPQMP